MVSELLTIRILANPMHIIHIGSDNKNLKSLEGMYICICFVLEQHLDYYDHC